MSTENKVKFDSPVGTWSVTTEGDCEGRTTKDLGIHKGHIVDIALLLGKKQYYSLQFKPAEEIPYPEPSDKCRITLAIESGTWNMGHEERMVAVQEFLNKEKPTAQFQVNQSPFYASVEIVRK